MKKRNHAEKSLATQKTEIIRLKDINVKLDRELNKALTDLKNREWEVKQLESKYYYACISRGDCGAFNGPKLIYRTSKDDWIPPTGPYTYHVMFRGITNSLGIRICGPKSVTGYVLST